MYINCKYLSWAIKCKRILSLYPNPTSNYDYYSWIQLFWSRDQWWHLPDRVEGILLKGSAKTRKTVRRQQSSTSPPQLGYITSAGSCQMGPASCCFTIMFTWHFMVCTSRLVCIYHITETAIWNYCNCFWNNSATFSESHIVLTANMFCHVYVWFCVSSWNLEPILQVPWRGILEMWI
jgi:hypothetical protein